jgi:circadian clock protein KaiC
MVPKPLLNTKNKLETLPKTPTGIDGVDEITMGGLPSGRSTLVCGSAGCGKTLFSLEFIVRGAQEFNEPGVFVAFEEKPSELAANVSSLGFDLNKLQKEKKVRIDYIHIDRSEIEETGEYNLEGLFIRLNNAIDSIGAKRVVLDTLENLFSGLSNEIILRAELRRLFQWLKDKGVTSIITGERGEKTLTRQGLEEYVSDCVILLDHRVINQISTRRIRIVKYRGSLHGTNEYPFLIDEDGLSVLPVTSMKLNKRVLTDKVSTGIPALDKMMAGEGIYRGSSILVSGTAGTGKTSIASTFIDAACSRKEKCMYFAFEESPQQIIRNMRSIGIDLEKHIDKGLLEFCALRPTLYGLEMHLVAIHKAIRKFRPKVVVLDPITNLITVGSVSDVKSMLVRLIDYLQEEQITVMFTALSLNNIVNEQTDEGVSSLVDTWLLIRDIESNGERNRGIYIMKSRGIKHSNQVREFVITDHGLDLIDVYIGPDGILTGSARESQMMMEETGQVLHTYALGRKDRELLRKRKVLEAKIDSLNVEFESTEEELNKIYVEEDLKNKIMKETRQKVADLRRGHVSDPEDGKVLVKKKNKK